MKISIIFIFAFIFVQALNAQEMLGQFGTEEIKEREVTSFSIDNDNATLIIATPFPNLIIETSRRNIIRSTSEEGRKIYILPQGTQRIKLTVKGYETVELEPYSFQKKKVYDLKLFEVRAPRSASTPVGKGSIEITTEPPNATITFDGLPGQWATPAKIENILATTYTIIVAKEKYDSVVFSTTVIQDSLLILSAIKLAPQIGFLRIVTDPNVLLALNGKSLKFDSASVVELLKGTHSVELSKAKYEKLSQEIEITPNDTTVIRHKMIPTFAFFDFSSLVNDTKITVDGKNENRNLVEVSSGEHVVEIQNKRVGKLSKKFNLSPGAIRTLIENDFQSPGTLIVSTDVKANLLIDGKKAALEPIENEVPAGIREIKLQHPDLGGETRDIQVLPGKKKEVFISLLPTRSTAAWLTIIPGGSQIYKGQTTKGVFYLLTFAAASAGTYFFHKDFTEQSDIYTGMVNEYSSAASGVRSQHGRLSRHGR